MMKHTCRPFIGGATVSNGTTLTDDVKSAKTIVSFSEDALYIGLSLITNVL
jgi:hypothetical protein